MFLNVGTYRKYYFVPCQPLSLLTMPIFGTPTSSKLVSGRISKIAYLSSLTFRHKDPKLIFNYLLPLSSKPVISKLYVSLLDLIKIPMRSKT